MRSKIGTLVTLVFVLSSGAREAAPGNGGAFCA